ncbi:hypothetical protein AVEN_200899-1, partial [Araneus ventricosus]
VTWSCILTLGTIAETTTNPLECNEPLISQCQCGESGGYEEVYVSSCQVDAADNSSHCKPCPGSCGAYVLCKTCSKEGCLSCPPGRWGQFCENAENSEANNLNYTEASQDEVKSYTEEIADKPANFDSFPPKSVDNISIENLPPEKPSKGLKYKGKLRKNKNYRNPIAVTDAAMTTVTDGNAEQPNNDKGNVHYADVFGSNDNPEVSHLLSNKTEKFTSMQKSKETLTILHGSFKENDKDEFLPSAIKHENETAIGDDKFINANDSLTYTMDSVNSPRSDVLSFRSGNISSSKNIDLKEDNFEEISKENSDEKLDNSSSHWKYPFESPEVHENENLEESEKLNSSSRHLKLSYESSEVHARANSEKNEKMNSSSRRWKFLYESPEMYENYNLEENENLNGSSRHWKSPYGSSEVRESANSEESEKVNGSSRHWKSPYESSEVRESANSEENERLNGSSSHWKSPYESSEVRESPNVGKHESKSKVMDGQPSEQKSGVETGRFFEREFDLRDIQFPSLSFSYRKGSFQASEPENESSRTSKESKNSKINPMGYRLAFVFGNSSLKEGNFSEISSNKQSDSSEMVSESPEMQIPLNVSIFKIKIIDTEGNASNVDAEFTNASREQVEAGKITKSSGMSDDQIKLSENNSKEFDIVSPLEVNVFKITFLGEDSESPYNNHNITEGRLIENYEKSNVSQTSQNKTSELPENIALGFEAATPQNASVFRVTILKENTSSSSDEKNQNITIKPLEDKRGANTNEKRANYKRNATNRPHDGLLYDTDILHKMIMESPEFAMNKAKKSDDEQLYSSQSFSKSNIPENHILMPLYFPEMYNAEYRSNFLDNGQLQRLCDLYPNYSPCFRVRMLSPGSPYIDAFGSQSPIQSKHYLYKSSPNGRYFHHFPQVKYYDSEGNMNMRSYAENGQNRLTDSQILALLKQYFQSKNVQSTSSLPLKNSKPLDETFLSGQPEGPQYLIQGWNKEEQPKEGFDSTLLSGLINYFLSLISPKYGGGEPTAQSAILRQQEFYRNKPGQSVASREVIEFPLDVNQPLRARSFPNTFGHRYSRPLDILKALESHAEYSAEESTGSIQNGNSSSKMFPETADSMQIKVIRPVFGQASFENDNDKREKLNFLESAEDAIFESCAKCVFTESVYEPVGREEKREKSLPTIFRALIVEEEGLLFGNQSDSTKQNASRSKRSMYAYGTHSWCPIERRMLNGDLDCTIWSYQKVCTLVCHPGYTCKSNTFTCSHRTNTWNPNLGPCEPITQYNSFGYRHGNDSSKENEFNYLSNGNEHIGNMGNYNYTSDNMEIDNREASFPNYEPPALQSEFGNIQGFPGDLTADRKENSSFDDNQGFPGYEELDGKDNSTFDNGQSALAGDKKDNSNFYNIQGVPGEVAVNRKSKSQIGKTRDFPDVVVMDGKVVDCDKTSNSSNLGIEPAFIELEGRPVHRVIGTNHYTGRGYTRGDR